MTAPGTFQAAYDALDLGRFGVSADAIRESARRRLAAAMFARDSLAAGADPRGADLNVALASEQYSDLDGDPASVQPDHVHVQLLDGSGAFPQYGVVPLDRAERGDDGAWVCRTRPGESIESLLDL